MTEGLVELDALLVPLPLEDDVPLPVGEDDELLVSVGEAVGLGVRE